MTLDKEYIVKLTLAVYKVTRTFPENEPLRHKIREKANDILADFAGSNPQAADQERTIQGINAILALFEVAEVQDWLDKRNFLILEREYRQIRQEIESLPEIAPKKPEQKKITEKEPKIALRKQIFTEAMGKTRPNLGTSPVVRQKKIVEIVKNKGKASLEELQQVFSDISSRTLRRDLRSLVGKGALERVRESKKDIIFFLKTEISHGQPEFSR